ncbi:MAG TPA: TetR/AcrR family transcriptional regulator [Sphingobium sp.]
MAEIYDRLGKGGTRTAALKVFETARYLFYRRGIRAVGVDEIVCEAGVTKPSLYRAFKSKDDLVAACVRESAREERAAIMAAIGAADSSTIGQLRALIQYHEGKIQSPDFRGCQMTNILVELRDENNPGRKAVEVYKTELREQILQLARNLSASNPEQLTDGLIMLIEGGFATHHIFGSQGPVQSLMTTCEALIHSHLHERLAPVSRGT